jgi:hypothetical protein
VQCYFSQLYIIAPPVQCCISEQDIMVPLVQCSISQTHAHGPDLINCWLQWKCVGYHMVPAVPWQARRSVCPYTSTSAHFLTINLWHHLHMAPQRRAHGRLVPEGSRRSISNPALFQTLQVGMGLWLDYPCKLTVICDKLMVYAENLEANLTTKPSTYSQ